MKYDINIRLATDADLENMRQLRNATRGAYFYTAEVSEEQQRAWWANRDQGTLYFVGDVACEEGCISRPPLEGWCGLCNGTNRRHVWQFSLSQDGVLGNLATAAWINGQGVAKHCVSRVLVPGTYYWGLFRTDNPSILRFWPSLGFPEPANDPPVGKDRDGHPIGSVQWVSHTWTEADCQRHRVKPWYVEQSQRIALAAGRNPVLAQPIVDRVAEHGYDHEAVAWLHEGGISGAQTSLVSQGLPPHVADAVGVLIPRLGQGRDTLEYLLRVKRASPIARKVLQASLEASLSKPDMPDVTELKRLAWWILNQE